MTATLAIRPYRPADLQTVLDLLKISLGETDLLRRTPEAFAWKHLENPFGSSIMLVAEDEEGIVGFRAFMRWELATPDGDLLHCVRAVDTATHPRAQRRGIFRRLTLEAVEAARLDDIDLIFNTPNPRSGAGYLTMGWSEVGAIGVLVRPRFMGLFGRHGDLPSVVGLSEWDDRSIIDRIPRGLRTRRTSAYFRWRFALHPTAGYRVAEVPEGTAVVRPNLRRNRRELVVSDLFGNGAGQALRQAARATDAAYLAGWFSPGSPERRHALSAGMIPVPWVTSLTLVAQPLQKNLEWVVGDLSRWDLALSDLELL
ncbi:MAG: GNAT family N-acetyltransferase [Acidimicrobiia bacterium]